jgi:hypothetical protein
MMEYGNVRIMGTNKETGIEEWNDGAMDGKRPE